MLNKNVQNAINDQIKAELYSSYIYLAMSAHFESENLPGFAQWTRLQADEEMEHTMKLFDYVNERGGRVVLQAIDQPIIEYGTPLETFEMIYAHEQKVTGLIHQLYALALKEEDYATQVMLHWFIDEQVEEESNSGMMVEQLKMVGDSKPGILHLDRHAGKRAGE